MSYGGTKFVINLDHTSACEAAWNGVCHLPDFPLTPLMVHKCGGSIKTKQTRLMGLLLVSVYICFLASAARLLPCMADDRLGPGKSLSLNQTIASAGGSFALGFFSLGNSTSTYHYLGIWYNNIPQQTVVWIANRENPLTDSAGTLRIAEDGNILLLDAERSIIWSSNVSSNTRNTSAVLMESGNLVLRDGEGSDVWQSFHHPTDTYLPGMEVEMDFRTGFGPRLVAWTGEQDPSPGSFSLGIDPKSPLQVSIEGLSGIRWRSAPWDGKQITGSMDSNSSTLLVQSIAVNEQKIILTYITTKLFLLSRLVLDSSGQLNFCYWDNNEKNWTLVASRPSIPCEFYGRCGPFGICDSGASSLCRCLEGFEPKHKKEWESGNFTGGCVRRQVLECDGTDIFLRSCGVKLPDKFSILWNTSAVQCEAKCRADCQCTAYAHSNTSRGIVLGSRCLIWAGELMDLARYGIVREDLYVRHAASELDANSVIPTISKRKIMHKILVPTSIVGMLLVVILCYMIWRRQKERVRKRNEMRFSDMLASEKDISEVPLLDFGTVSASTNNFAAANKLGQGGFGPVYKGMLFRCHEIAVKRLSKSSGQGFQEFANEVQLIAKLQHTNLVRLLGWCSNEDEKILIYEYMPNGSLDKIIFDQRRSAELDWERRFEIIQGIANGLLYLHRHSRLHVIHRDLKASNILLDASMSPKISDFGLARIFGGNQTEAHTERVVGTYGYMAPEYALDGLFSEKSDVFSFGVILLEIITGKRSTGFYPYKESLNLLGYVWQMWKEGRCLELIDPWADGTFGESEVMRCIQVGLLCVQDNAAERPMMSSVIFMLGKENASLPVPKQPAFAIKTPDPVQANELFTIPREQAKEVTIRDSD